MKDVEIKVIEKATELLQSGAVQRVIGWTKGEFCYDPSPATFDTVDSLKDFVYDDFCGANLSKYLIQLSKAEGKTAVFLKPCDTYSFNQLVKEHRIDREKFHVVGVECRGKLDIYKIKELGADGVIGAEGDDQKITVATLYGDKVFDKADVLLEKCLTCKGKEHKAYDETIILHEAYNAPKARFSEVENLENMTEEERFNFWQGQLSKCIRCNACRNVCPACSCIKCVFDNPQSGVAAKANDVSFEEQLFHVIRAFHVSGRCTDCGECSRVCPQRIPLHLLNRKFIKDIDNFYGDFTAGEVAEGKTPLTSFTENDIEANNVFGKGESK